MNEHDRPLTPSEIAATKDENIDFSEIPELDDDFCQQAVLIEPEISEKLLTISPESVFSSYDENPEISKRSGDRRRIRGA